MEFTKVGVYGEVGSPVIPPEHTPYGSWESDWIELQADSTVEIEPVEGVDFLIKSPEGKWIPIEEVTALNKFKVRLIIFDTDATIEGLKITTYPI